MTVEQMRQECIDIVATLTDEQCVHVKRLFVALPSLNDTRLDKACQLLQGGMSLDELVTLIESGGMPE